MKKITSFLLIFYSIGTHALVAEKKNALILDKSIKENVKMEKGSIVFLNQVIEKKIGPNSKYYTVNFICKKEKCSVAEVILQE